MREFKSEEGVHVVLGVFIVSLFFSLVLYSRFLFKLLGRDGQTSSRPTRLHLLLYEGCCL